MVDFFYGVYIITVCNTSDMDPMGYTGWLIDLIGILIYYI